MKKKLMGILIFCLLLCAFGTAAFAAEKEELPYYVTVNLTDNIVTVYEQDETGSSRMGAACAAPVKPTMPHIQIPPDPLMYSIQNQTKVF